MGVTKKDTISKLPTEARPQGEALAISPTGYFTISEGGTPPIWFFAADGS